MNERDRQLADYLDGTLGEEAANQLARALEQDPDALERLTELSRLDRMLCTRHAPFDEQAFSQGVIATIKGAEHAPAAPATPRRRRWLLPAAALAAACLLWMLDRPGTPPAPETPASPIPHASLDVTLDGHFETANTTEGPWKSVRRSPRDGELLRLVGQTGAVVYPDGSRVTLTRGGIFRLIRNHGPRVRLYAGAVELANKGATRGQIALAAGTVDVPAGCSVAVILEVVAGTAEHPQALRVTLDGKPDAARASFLRSVAIPHFLLPTEMAVPAAMAPQPRPDPQVRARASLHLTRCGMWEVDAINTSRISG